MVAYWGSTPAVTAVTVKDVNGNARANDTVSLTQTSGLGMILTAVSPQTDISGRAIFTVQSNVITVRGLDAIDGTPLLDIKPYFPQFDRIEQPVVPAWVERLMRGYF